MLGLLTTKSSISVQPIDSQIQMTPSTDYLVNLSNVIKMEVIDTNDSLLRVKLNKHEDRSPYFTMIADQTNSAIQTLADVSANSSMIVLPVFEGAVSFSDSTGSTTDKYFNVEDISWVEENIDGDISKMWVEEGGFALKPFFVDYSLAQFYDVLVDGATTTTTTTTGA